MQVISINGAPRSGTSWLGQLFNSNPLVSFRYQPLFSYEFKGALTEQSDLPEIKKFYSGINEAESDFVMQREQVKAGKYPSFQKETSSHLVFKSVRYHNLLPNLLSTDPELKFIGIVRHPCAVIYSWMNAPKEFDESWKIEEEWLNAPKKNLGKAEEFNGYNKWRELCAMFLELEASYKGRVKLVSYNELNRNTFEVLSDLFEFCGLTMDQQTQDFIEKSQSTTNTDAYSVYREKREDNSWVGRLSPMISTSILKDLASSPYQKLVK